MPIGVNQRTTFEVVPIPGEDYEGRQWGWRILMDGEPYLDCHMGGTGPCWNFHESPQWEGDEETAGDPVHICDLDEAIAALTALRESEAHKQNVGRW